MTEQRKALPMRYWLPKMHKASIGARFIVAATILEVLSEVKNSVFKTKTRSRIATPMGIGSAPY